MRASNLGWVVRAAVVLAWCAPARAAELGRLGEPLTLEVHAFVSQGFILTSANNYLAKSKAGSFEFSEVGLNFTAPLTDDLRVGVQLFARDLGPIGDYRATLDWYYLDYHWKDWLGMRAGRVKLPFGLYNDVSDVDAARAAVLLPQSVYPASSRDYLLAQTGVEAYGFVHLAAAGALDYRLYAGTIFIDIADQTGQPLQAFDLTIPYVAGGRVMWEPPIHGLRVGGSLQALRLDTKITAAGSSDATKLEIPAVLWVGSAEYIAQDLLVALEYSRWHVAVHSSNPMVLPESTTTSERAYAMAAYRTCPSLQLSLYYSLYYPNVEQRSGDDAMQHDAAFTLRFDVNPFWLVKLEGHYLHGTAVLSSTLNPDRPRSELAPDWGLFLLKTTAYF